MLKLTLYLGIIESFQNLSAPFKQSIPWHGDLMLSSIAVYIYISKDRLISVYHENNPIVLELANKRAFYLV